MNISIIKLVMGFAYFVSLFFLIYWLLYFLEKEDSIKKDLKKPRPNLKRYPFVSIVIPAYNEQRHIIKTLNSVCRLDYPKASYEIIVVNDCSKDKTGKIVQDYITALPSGKSPSIRLINNKKNLGKAESLNVAFESSKGEYFACIDADSAVESQALVYILDMFERDPKLAIVTPVMKIDEPKTWIQKFQRLEYMTSMLVSRLMGYMDCMYVAPGPFSVYKSSVLKKLGRFDGTHNIEDQEIAWRAQKHHYKIRQCPNAYVYTVGPNNITHFTRQRTRWYRGSLLTLYDYRSMLFNRKYGDFGMFQIPLIIMSYLLSLIALFAFAYYLITPLLRQLHKWILINFDIVSELQQLKFTFRPLDIEFSTVIFIYAALFITVVLLYFASRSSNEKIRKYGNIYIILYFFVFYILLGFIFVKSVIEVLFRRKQRW